ncbi:MAG: rod shape-determining protein MreD, partial [Lachnospiraceae bacterium]|nr:rod shape-determining protein MreD [Lachnospiraceae bacterium]
VPNMLLCAAISIGFLYGRTVGLASGIVCGLLWDILGMGIPGFYTLLFAWLGYLNGLISEKLESEIIVVLFLFLAVNEAVFHAYVFGLGYLFNKRFAFSAYVTEVFLPELVLSLIAFIVIHGVLLFISRKWDLRINKGEVVVV